MNKESIRASSKASWLWSYGQSVLLVGLATVLSLLLVELADRVIFILYYAAVATATWRGGLRAGFLATTLSALAIVFFLLPPLFSFSIGLPVLIQVIAFVLVALLIVSLIGGRMQAEAALVEREKQLRLIINAAPVLISYIGVDLRYRFNNRTYESWFGLPQTEIPGRHVRTVLGETAYQALLPHYEAALAGQQVSYEQLIPYESGERYVQATYTPDFDEQGQVRGFVVLVNDLSQRKQAEESLQSARAEAEQVRARLERILAGIKDDFVMYDHAWRYVYVNDQAAQTLGYPKEQLIGQCIWELFPGAVDNLFYQKMHQAKAEGREITFEHYYPPFDRWFENRAYPISEGMLLFSSDITERKRAEEALRESEERFRQVAEVLPQFIWITRVDGSLEYVNQHWINYSGLDLAATNDPEKLAAAIHPDDRAELFSRWEKSLVTGELLELEARLRSVDGAFHWFVIRTVPLRDETGRVVKWFGASIDIHEQKLTEADTRFFAEIGERIRLARDAEELLYEASRAVGDYLDVQRTFFVEIDDANNRGLVRRDYCRGAESVAGEYKVSEYSAAARAEIAAGHTIVNCDSQSDPRTAASYEATYRPRGERAYVAVPLMRERHWEGTFWVSTDQPRLWQAREVALLETVAERVWSVAEKLRIDAALRESEARFRRMADSVPVMISLTGPDKGCTYFNHSWLEFTGRSMEQELGFGWAENLHPDDRDRYLEIYHIAFDARQPYETEYRLCRHDGEYRWIVDRAIPLFEGDYFAGYISSSIDIHERKRAELAERLLAETGKVLVSSLDPTIQLSNIASLAVPDLADWCAVDLYEEDWTVHHVAVAHVDPAKVQLAQELQQRYPPQLEELQKESQPWQRGESQLYPQITEAMLEAGARDADHYYILRELRLNSAMIVPLVVRDRVLGLMAFFWAESGHRYDQQDLALAEELARRAAVAIDNARAYEAERRARAEAETAGGRLRLLAEASEVLIASTSYEIALSTLARLLVPHLADWCAVDLIGQDGLIHRLAVVHRDPARAEAADQLQRRYPIIDPRRDHTITKMLRRGQSWFDPEVSETRLAAEARDAEHLQLLRELGFASEMVVLLTARGRTLGALTLVRISSDHCYEAADLDLAEELARRATIVVDNARLYEAEQQAREAAEEATQRITGLQAVTARLATALTPADVVQVVLEEGLPAMGSNAGSVVRLDGEEIEVVGTTGFPEKVTRPWQRFSLSASTPIAEVARTGQSVWLESPEAFKQRYGRLPDPAALAISQSWGALPLVAYGRVLGALALSYSEPQLFDADSRRFAETLADLCAQALERARLYHDMQQLNVELEERVVQRTAELERSLKELDQFTYIASHDLKAPLRGVKQLSTWIVEDAGDTLPEDSKVHLAKMQSRIQRMEKLLDDLLMYSRIGRSYYGSLENIDTGALVQEIIELLAPPPTFTIMVQAEMPSLTCSRMLLELVFKNLIENAIKHHHRVDGRIEISASERDDVVEFWVADDGPGIDERFHDRIFQIFQTLQPRDKIDSTGVGLAIVKKTVENQGGTIRIISAEGQGTTFHFTWPKN
jgi:PAS domain S-box-containing protein